MMQKDGRILLLWKETPVGFGAAQEALTLLSTEWPSGLSLCMEEQNATPEDFSCVLQNPAFTEDAAFVAGNYDFFLLPMLPVSLIEELVNAEVQSLLGAVVFYALCMGKRVAVLKSAVDTRTKDMTATPLSQKIEDRLNQIRSVGIEIINCSDLLADTIPSEINELCEQKSRWIVEEDIFQLARNSETELLLHNGDRMTPLAADTAKEKNITITRKR
jgi:hypothetical protein